MIFAHVNLLAVLVAAIVQWLLGYLWYGVLFNKDYKALVHREDAPPMNAGAVMGLIFIANLILSMALARIVVLTGLVTFGKGALVGVICGLGFVLPPMFAEHLSERRPFKLFGINSVYWLIAMYVSGGILAIWQ